MAIFNSISDYLNDLNRRINESNALVIAAKDTSAEMSERIFIEGQSVQGDIGKYSTTATYIGDKNSPKKGTHKGKNDDTKFKDGRPHTTTYYEGGYSEYRSAMGRDNKGVNLSLTGRLETNFNNALVENNADEVVLRLTAENTAKARGNELRFNKRIFSLTKEERERFVDTLKFELFKSLRGA